MKKKSLKVVGLTFFLDSYNMLLTLQLEPFWFNIEANKKVNVT